MYCEHVFQASFGESHAAEMSEGLIANEVFSEHTNIQQISLILIWKIMKNLRSVFFFENLTLLYRSPSVDK